MARAWILRSLRAEGYERLAFDRGLVAVGWGAVGDLAERTDFSRIHEAVRSGFPFVDAKSMDFYAGQLLQFRSMVERGDLVVLLRRASPDVAIGWVTGDYVYRTDLEADARHVRSVRWVRMDFPRAVVERELISLPPLSMVLGLDQVGIVERLQALIDGHESEAADRTLFRRDVPEESRPFANLQRNLNYARSLATAGQHLAGLEPGAFEVSDVFRAAWVQGIAALDYWVRQEVRSRMLRLARQSSGEKPQGFLKFEIPLEQIELLQQSRVSLADVVDEQLARTRGHLAYQHPDKIREAFSLVSDVKGLWNGVADVLSERAREGLKTTGKEVQDQLAAIVRRRNKIAHEYDENPDDPSVKRPIDGAEVTQAIDWIEQMAAAILEVLASDSNLGVRG